MKKFILGLVLGAILSYTATNLLEASALLMLMRCSDIQSGKTQDKCFEEKGLLSSKLDHISFYLGFKYIKYKRGT